jgi:predicted nucleotidyltransferase
MAVKVRESPMKTLDEIRAELRAMLPELRRGYPVAELGVFGSYARGEQTTRSDLDLLVDFDGPMDLFRLFNLEDEIADRLGVNVELVTRPALKPYIEAAILRELVPV